MTDHFSPKEVSCLTAWYPLAATRHRVVAYFGCFTENLPHMADVSDVPCFSSYPHRKRKLRVLCKRFWRFSVLQMHFVSCSRVKLWFFELAFDRGRLVWGSGNSSSSFPASSLCLNTLWSVVPNFSLCTVSPSMLSLYCKIILRDFKSILLRNCAAFARTILTAVLNVVALSNFPLYRISEIALLNSMALLYFVFQAVAYMHGKGIMHRAESWVSTFSKKQ